MRLIAACVAAVLSVTAFGQEPVKPGPEHDLLKKHVGTWDTTMKVGGMEFKGTATYKMDLGGLWLVSTMDSEMFGQKFTGHGHDSYDAGKKKYIGLWVDSMNTLPVLMEGTYDEAKKSWIMSGTGPGPDGPTTKFKSVTEFPDADTFVMSMTMGDGKEASFVITYKRKK